MNILYVTAYDSMGQQFNGYSLQKELQKLNCQSNMYVLEKKIEDQNIHLLGGKISRSINGILGRVENELSLHNVLLNLGRSLIQSTLFKSADVVHLQLLHAKQFISLLNLPEIARKRPVVWTIHDPWLTTGHCIHPLDCKRWLDGCGSCPDLATPVPMKFDATALNWKIKYKVMHRANIHLIAASEWMASCFHSSPILHHLPFSVIPFGVDTRIFRPIDKSVARAHFNIPSDAHVIAFRWAPYFKIKGSEYIKRALELLQLKRDTYVILMDAPHSYGMPELQGKYQFVDLGWLEDRETTAMALNAADVFLMPSLAESFGLMAVESMACGTPVIVFEDTALEGVIKAPQGGIAVPYKDAEALSASIENILENKHFRTDLAASALKVVQDHYTVERYALSHLALYESVIRKFASNTK